MASQQNVAYIQSQPKMIGKHVLAEMFERSRYTKTPLALAGLNRSAGLGAGSQHTVEGVS